MSRSLYAPLAISITVASSICSNGRTLSATRPRRPFTLHCSPIDFVVMLSFLSFQLLQVCTLRQPRLMCVATRYRSRQGRGREHGTYLPGCSHIIVFRYRLSAYFAGYGQQIFLCCTFRRSGNVKIGVFGRAASSLLEPKQCLLIVSHPFARFRPAAALRKAQGARGTRWLRAAFSRAGHAPTEGTRGI